MTIDIYNDIIEQHRNGNKQDTFELFQSMNEVQKDSFIELLYMAPFNQESFSIMYSLLKRLIK